MDGRSIDECNISSKGCAMLMATVGGSKVNVRICVCVCRVETLNIDLFRNETKTIKTKWWRSMLFSLPLHVFRLPHRVNLDGRKSIKKTESVLVWFILGAASLPPNKVKYTSLCCVVFECRDNVGSCWDKWKTYSCLCLLIIASYVNGANGNKTMVQ